MPIYLIKKVHFHGSLVHQEDRGNGKVINFVTGCIYTRAFPTNNRRNNLPNRVLYNTFRFTKHFSFSFDAREIQMSGSLFFILSSIAVSFLPFYFEFQKLL